MQFQFQFQALTINQVCGSTPSGTIVSYVVDCEDPPKIGRYVSLQRKKADFWDIGEVEIIEETPSNWPIVFFFYYWDTVYHFILIDINHFILFFKQILRITCTWKNYDLHDLHLLSALEALLTDIYKVNGNPFSKYCKNIYSVSLLTNCYIIFIRKF